MHDMTREELMETNMKRTKRLMEYKEGYLGDNYKYEINNCVVLYHGEFPFGLSVSMFYTTIQNLGTDEQANKWLPSVRNLRILGCYA